MRDFAHIILDPDELIKHVNRIAEWDRETATPGHWKAAKYVLTELESAGIECVQEVVPVIRSLPIEGTLTIAGARIDGCITHSFGGSTGASAVQGRIVYVPADEQVPQVNGDIVLTHGLASPVRCHEIERQGGLAAIFINGKGYPHNMAVSSVWGQPDLRTVEDLPSLPVISLPGASGESLSERLRSGEVLIGEITTTVETSIVEAPQIVAHVRPTHPIDEHYVLFNGHLDAWHRGGLDNASGNAAMLEIAKAAYRQRDILTAGVKVLFWAGHSDGRYSGSDWWADHNWQDIYENAIVNFNIDSIGALGSTWIGQIFSSAQCFDIGQEIVQSYSDQVAQYARIQRNGDQSFWAHGVPSLFQVLSLLPPSEQSSDTFVAGLPWYWHTTQDTSDKVGRDELAADAQIYLEAIMQFATRGAYPFRFSTVASEMRENLIAASASLPLGQAGQELVELLEGIVEAAGEFDRETDRIRRDALRSGVVDREAVVRRRKAAMEINQRIIPAHYCLDDGFHPDPALPGKPFPGLYRQPEPTERDSEFRLHAYGRGLRRELNRIRWMLVEFRNLLDQA